MSRPRTTKAIAARVPLSLKEKIEEAATKLEADQSDIIVNALNAYLETIFVSA